MVGVWLFLWAMLAVWVLGLFSLQREARRFRRRAGAAAVSPAPPTGDPYPGLLDLPFVAASAPRARRLTLALGGVIFLRCPGRPGTTRTGQSGTIDQAPDRVRRGGQARPARRDPRERQRRDERRALRRGTRAGSPRRPSRSGGASPWRATRTGAGNGSSRSLQTVVSLTVPQYTARSSAGHPPAHPAGAERLADPVRPPADARAPRRAPRSSPTSNPVDGTIFRPSPGARPTTTRSSPTRTRRPPARRG